MWPEQPPFFLTTTRLIPEGMSLSCGCSPQKKGTVSAAHDGNSVFWRHKCGAKVGAQRELYWQEAEALGLLPRF